MTSNRSAGELDLEHDLPTTEEDVIALCSARDASPFCDLRSLNLLDASRYFRNAEPRTTVFPDQPPFEL